MSGDATGPEETPLGPVRLRARNCWPRDAIRVLSVPLLMIVLFIVLLPRIRDHILGLTLPVIPAILLLAFLLFGPHSPVRHLVLCERGVRWRRGELGGFRDFPFEAFVEVGYRFIPQNNADERDHLLSAALRTADGAEISLAEFESGDAELIVSMIRPNVLNRLESEAFSCVRAGEVVRVGELELSISGIARWSLDPIPWPDVGGFRLGADYQILRRSRPDEPLCVPVSTPNLAIVSLLIDRMPDWVARHPDAVPHYPSRVPEPPRPTAVPGYPASDREFGSLIWAEADGLRPYPLAFVIAALCLLGRYGDWGSFLPPRLSYTLLAALILIISIVAMVAMTGLGVYEHGVRRRWTRVGFDETSAVSHTREAPEVDGREGAHRICVMIRGPRGRIRIAGPCESHEPVARLVLGRVLPRLTREATERVGAGGSLEAGGLRLTAAGLHVPGRATPLPAPFRVRTDAGQVRLFHAGEVAAVASVPAEAENLPVLLGLVRA